MKNAYLKKATGHYYIDSLFRDGCPLKVGDCIGKLVYDDGEHYYRERYLIEIDERLEVGWVADEFDFEEYHLRENKRYWWFPEDYIEFKGENVLLTTE